MGGPTDHHPQSSVQSEKLATPASHVRRGVPLRIEGNGLDPAQEQGLQDLLARQRV